MGTARTVDVAFLPISGMTVMDEEAAADAAARLQPGLAVPIHWGDLHGRYPIARRFVELCAARGVRAATAAG